MKRVERIAKAKRLVRSMARQEERLNSAMERWLVAHREIAKANRAVDKIENAIEATQSEIENLIGGPYHGQEL